MLESHFSVVKSILLSVLSQFAVAALSERRKSLRIQDRWSETAATKFRLRHYPPLPDNGADHFSLPTKFRDTLTSCALMPSGPKGKGRVIRTY